MTKHIGCTVGRVSLPTSCLCWEPTAQLCLDVLSRLLVASAEADKHAAKLPEAPIIYEQLANKYTIGKHIGSGGFGVVHSCQKGETNEELAVKMVSRAETSTEDIEHEIAMFRRLHHPSIVKLHEVIYERDHVCMVLDLLRGGDLVDGMQLHWRTKGMIAMPVVRRMGKMMAQSIDWLHQHSIVHRDVKGENFLMDCTAIEDPKCRIFLSDFGTAVELRGVQRLSHQCGTRTHWAPELHSRNYGLAVDIWALGVIVFGLGTGRFPFKGEECRKRQVPIPPRSDRVFEEFVLAALQKTEAKRLTADRAVEHRFLSSQSGSWWGSIRCQA